MKRPLFVAVVALAVLRVGAAGWIALAGDEQPSFTCSTPNAKACTDTERSIREDRRFVFSPELPARPLSVDVRPAIAGSTHEGDWSALLTLEGQEPMLVVCYYSSEEMVSCDPA